MQRNQADLSLEIEQAKAMVYLIPKMHLEEKNSIFLISKNLNDKLNIIALQKYIFE